ncbi:MAG: primosomal protein N' [Thermoguttaceae bacterium]|nr:primosomal protein N' [Thermoguttaceae bacterium]MDW8078806.1 primosomal protein N' [Thermoguttaceae bacterium]
MANPVGEPKNQWLFDFGGGAPLSTREIYVARVAFPRAPRGLFDYLVPENLSGQIGPGTPLRVPLGKGGRIHFGYCVQLGPQTLGQRKLKPVQGVADQLPPLPLDLLELASWMVDYYVADWSEVLQTLLPTAIREGKVPTRPCAQLTEQGYELLRSGERPSEISRKQWQILRFLAAHGPVLVRSLTKEVACSTVPITALRKRGLVTISHISAAPEYRPSGTVLATAPPQLTAEQTAAYHAICQALERGGHEVLLLHGVTGSGKTELYLRAIGETLRLGKQAIVLVPEISLTPQMVERFQSRFDRVAVLHSQLSKGERRRFWTEISRGDISVVVGARSAVFAPTPRLGLIIVDEEHEWSFKQETAPRYHAREVAIARGRILGIPVILGSATPALETFWAAHSGICQCLELRQRVHGRPLPQVEIVDLRDPNWRAKTRSIISPPLHQAIHDTLGEGGQVLLLLNRRGFAGAVLCPVCGQVLRCPGCDIALTFHKLESKAICHYCGYEQFIPQSCPSCSAHPFCLLGFGTQRLEAELKRRFPDAKIARVDADAMRAKGAYEKTLAAFQRGELQILLGTQIIAKGLDFPNVVLVGVVYADLAIHFPDFRASERTFQLLTQVAGRTGRGDRPGRVIIQTYCPEHLVIQAAAAHDYQKFAAAEIPIRQRFGYPPFSRAVRFVIRGKKQDLVRLVAESVADVIKRNFSPSEAEYRLLGPAPCFLSRMARRHRYHVVLLSSEPGLCQQAARKVSEQLKCPEDVTVTHDIDPLDML